MFVFDGVVVVWGESNSIRVSTVCHQAKPIATDHMTPVFCPKLFRFDKVVALKQACGQWLRMMEEGIEDADDVPTACVQALEVTRAVLSLVDSSVISPDSCDYQAVGALAAGSKKSDRAYSTLIGVQLVAVGYYKDLHVISTSCRHSSALF